MFLKFYLLINLFLTPMKEYEYKQFDNHFYFEEYLTDNGYKSEIIRLKVILDVEYFYIYDTKEIVANCFKNNYKVILYQDFTIFSKYCERKKTIIEIESLIKNVKPGKFFIDKEIIENMNTKGSKYYDDLEKLLSVENIDNNTSYEEMNKYVIDFIKKGGSREDIILPLIYYCGQKILGVYGGKWTYNKRSSNFFIKYSFPILEINGRNQDIARLVGIQIESSKNVHFEDVIDFYKPFIEGKIIVLPPVHED
jgi:hypothetical protein